MEDGVTFGWRTEYLKYMAKTSIAGGDYKVARKYIDMLKRTLFHKEWAEKYETYLDHPEQIRKSKEFCADYPATAQGRQTELGPERHRNVPAANLLLTARATTRSIRNRP